MIVIYFYIFVKLFVTVVHKKKTASVAVFLGEGIYWLWGLLIYIIWGGYKNYYSKYIELSVHKLIKILLII